MRGGLNGIIGSIGGCDLGHSFRGFGESFRKKIDEILYLG